PYHVSDDFVVIRGGSLILPVAVRTIHPLDSRWQWKTLDFPVFNLVEVLPADLHDPPLSDERDAALEVLVVGASRPEEGAHGPAGEAKPRSAAVLYLDLVILRLDAAPCVYEFAAQPDKQVHEVAHLSEQRSTFELLAPEPRRLEVVTVVTVPY